MCDKVIKINYRREMRSLINQIKHIGLNSDGILFGGIVRDDIIGTHYRNLFIEKKMNFDKYWDNSYDIETKYRTILPNDIDIFFRNENTSNIFIKKLKDFIGGFYNSFVNIKYENTFNNNNNYTNNYAFLLHKKITIHLVIGNTLTNQGKALNLNIDLIEIDYNNQNMNNAAYIDYIKHIEPPFYNIDFLSNIFITEKVNSSIITRISNCTGTEIDSMIFTKKTNITTKIINDIINFKTQFVNNLDYFNSEYINCYRILKMIERQYSWNITNIPFTFINITDLIEDVDDKCCICLDDIIINNTTKEEFKQEHLQIVKLTINKIKPNYFHTNCFISYLKKEQKSRYIDEKTRKIECRCPFRNLFNFKDCHKNIEYI